MRWLIVSALVASPVLAVLALPDTGQAQRSSEPTPYERARECSLSGDNVCVIRELHGHCTNAREYELLIAALRATGGPEADVMAQMREYLGRFPSGRMATQYRQFLLAHERLATP